MNEEKRMTKAELMKEYQDLLAEGEEPGIVILYIHMPGDVTEIIVNPAVSDKMEYIDKTYNDDLVHRNSSEIYITGVVFSVDDGTMDFGSAIENLKAGERVARAGWNGKGMWIELCTPPGDFTDEMGQTYGRRPYIYMKTADDMLVPWVASQTDILADDWMLVDPPELSTEANQETGASAAMPACM